MSTSKGKYEPRTEDDTKKRRFKDYFIRYSLILCSIIVGFGLVTSLFKVDIFIFPFVYFGKLTVLSFLPGLIVIWLSLKLYDKKRDINNLMWINRKQGSVRSSKSHVIVAFVLTGLLITLIYQFQKYGTIFIAIYNNGGEVSAKSFLEGMSDRASVLIMSCVAVGIIDQLVAIMVRKKGGRIFAPIMQLTLLFVLHQEVFTSPVNLDQAALSTDDYVYIGVYILFIIAFIKTVISFVARLIDLCLSWHDQVLKGAQV
ncbi:hypothetical protein [Rossellomorea marisflavi]|uniref:hypothetical protein n=1 Tax=Rossellomorea marisflavi TaxID=189381 RepID=UPI00345AC5E9